MRERQRLKVDRHIRRWPFRIARGFGYLTLDPSPRLRRLRERQKKATGDGSGTRCPPLPDSAYPPGAVPLGTRPS